ncbi:MAG: hypothetical protein ACRDJE_07390, partial [Dehalococcoidia bacterium]
LKTTDDRAITRALFGLTSVRMVATLVFAFSGSFALALPVYLVGGVARRMSYPIQSVWLNRHVESRVRATVLSMNSQADALGQIAIGPAIGALGNVSIRIALAVSGLLLAPALVLYARADGQGRRDAETAEEVVVAER